MEHLIIGSRHKTALRRRTFLGTDGGAQVKCLWIFRSGMNIMCGGRYGRVQSQQFAAHAAQGGVEIYQILVIFKESPAQIVFIILKERAALVSRGNGLPMQPSRQGGATWGRQERTYTKAAVFVPATAGLFLPPKADFFYGQRPLFEPCRLLSSCKAWRWGWWR